MENAQTDLPLIGVGLRHPHYEDALATKAPVDFLEVHAENFFMAGGAPLGVLDAVGQHYPISIHGTALSLGALTGLNPAHVSKLQQLVQRVNPMLVSDHACFSQSHFEDGPLHLGDLLPIAFNEITLANLVRNIEQVQEALKRPIMIENLSAYIAMADNSMTETEFLVQACKRSGCQLLLDLNNLVVNATNAQSTAIAQDVTQFLSQIPKEFVGEFHLAGCTPVPAGEIMVDDHSQPVPDSVWAAYHDALTLMGPKPTLIEWDTDLPSWTTLLAEADKARTLAQEALLPTHTASSRSPSP